MKYSNIKMLAINSYAGSLVVAARSLGVKIIGSYEDVGYGLDIQRANFPKLRYVERRDDWPRQDLSEVIVAAHPPCTPFCAQGAGARDKKKHRGVTADAFTCTINVLNYALEQRCRALLIESVIGAYKNAESVHVEYARRYGYDLFRVLQNSVTFGVPQFRPRFWTIYVRRDLTPKPFTLRHRPVIKTVGETLDPLDDPGVLFYDMKKEVKREIKALCASGFSRYEALRLFKKPGHVTRRIIEEFPDRCRDVRGLEIMHKFFNCGWGSGMTTILDPKGFTGTLMSGYCWYYRGRVIGDREAKVIMGFPVDYIFPERYQRQIMTYLSRGVVPPVARWVMDETIKNVEGVKRPTPEVGERTYELEHGDVIDIRVKRQTLAFAEPAPSKAKQLRLFE